jgi:hypothetical protein
MIEVSRLSQKVMVLRSGTGRTDESKLMPANVLLMSAFTASKGVSSLDYVKDSSKKELRNPQIIDCML